MIKKLLLFVMIFLVWVWVWTKVWFSFVQDLSVHAVEDAMVQVYSGVQVEFSGSNVQWYAQDFQQNIGNYIAAQKNEISASVKVSLKKYLQEKVAGLFGD